MTGIPNSVEVHFYILFHIALCKNKRYQIEIWIIKVLLNYFAS